MGKADVAVLNGERDPELSCRAMERVVLRRSKNRSLFSLGVSSNVTLLAADFNSDGNLDLLLLQDPGNTFSIYSGHGDGSFANPVQVNDGLTAAGNVAIGDFNGDGRPDVAITGVSSVAVIFANPSGGFKAPIIVSTPYNVASYLPLALGDLNQDGHLDIVVTDEFGHFQFLLGDGRGHFNAQTPDLGSYAATAMAIADFNHDGKPDIALAKPTLFEQFDVGAVSVLSAMATEPLRRAPQASSRLRMRSIRCRWQISTGGLEPTFLTDPIYVVTSDAGGLLSEASYAAGGGPVGVGDFTGDGNAGCGGRKSVRD